MSLFSEATGSLFGGGGNKNVSGTQSKYGKVFNDAFNDYKTLHGLFGQGQNAAFGNALNMINAPAAQQEQKYAAGANEAAGQQAAQTAAFLRSQGFGDGLTAGAGQAAYQNAARQTNAYDAQVESPEYQQQRLAAFIQALQGINSPLLQQLQLGGNGVYGAPQQQDGGLAGVLGMFTGGWASALGQRQA